MCITRTMGSAQRQAAQRIGVGMLAAACTAPSLCEAPGGRLLATPIHPFAQQLAKKQPETVTKQETDDDGTVLVAGQRRSLAGWLAQFFAFAIDQIMDTAFR